MHQVARDRQREQRKDAVAVQFEQSLDDTSGLPGRHRAIEDENPAAPVAVDAEIGEGEAAIGEERRADQLVAVEQPGGNLAGFGCSFRRRQQQGVRRRDQFARAATATQSAGSEASAGVVETVARPAPGTITV